MKTLSHRTLLCSAILATPLFANAASTTTTTVEKGEKAIANAIGDKAKVDLYGSIRLGADFIDANVEQDGLNGRDFLSRVGVKASLKIDDTWTFISQIEYGTRSDVVDFNQNGGLTLRQINAGFKHKEYGSVKFGSLTTTFHKFVRGSYFSDGLDTIRLSTIREDDFLAYDLKQGKFKFGAGIQIEGQDGDNIDQIQFGAEYADGPYKIQGAVVRDNEGANEGGQFGIRGWWKINSMLTVSAYHHSQNDDFDFPSGAGSTGALRLRAANGGLGNINFVTTCVGEDRTATGVYGSVRHAKHQFHAKYGVDSCDDAGDVDSLKLEYVHHFGKKLRSWVSFENLETDAGRTPADLSEFGDSFRSVQLGARLDF